MAFSSSLLTAEWLNTTTNAASLFISFFIAGFSHVLTEPFTPHAYIVTELRRWALHLRTSTSRLLHALSTLPPWSTVNARKTSFGSTSSPISSPKNSVVSCGYKMMVEFQR